MYKIICLFLVFVAGSFWVEDLDPFFCDVSKCPFNLFFLPFVIVLSGSLTCVVTCNVYLLFLLQLQFHFEPSQLVYLLHHLLYCRALLPLFLFLHCLVTLRKNVKLTPHALSPRKCRYSWGFQACRWTLVTIKCIPNILFSILCPS